jgi:hypothetical protein
MVCCWLALVYWASSRIGGAVKGGDLFGAFPTLGPKNASNSNFGSRPDPLGNGTSLSHWAISDF